MAPMGFRKIQHWVWYFVYGGNTVDIPPKNYAWAERLTLPLLDSNYIVYPASDMKLST